MQYEVIFLFVSMTAYLEPEVKNYHIIVMSFYLNMGVRRGGQGGLLPPPPWKIFVLPRKKSADAMYLNIVCENVVADKGLSNVYNHDCQHQLNCSVVVAVTSSQLHV
jgi:hypothetical protein